MSVLRFQAVFRAAIPCLRVIAASAMLVMAASAGPAEKQSAPPGINFDAFNRDWEATIVRLSQHPDPKLAANKKLALDFLYGLVLATEGKVDVAEVTSKYLDPGYIQHDQNIPTGRDGFNKWFKAGAQVPNTPTAPKVDLQRIGLPRMVLAIAENDIVTTLSTHKWPDPADDSKDYDNFHIAIFRISNGRIAEHWSEALKGSYWCRFSKCDPVAKK